jgi:ABC-type glycerol-3-phosphate transport system permease component
MTRAQASPSRTILALVCTLPIVYPFAFLIATAIKPQHEFVGNPSGVPHTVTFSNFTSVWGAASLGPALLHSLLAVGVGVVLTVGASSAGAFWFHLHRGRSARVIRIVLVGTMALPPPVFIIPLYVLVSDAGLANNLIVLGCVYAAWNSSFGLYLVHTYLRRGIPREVLDSAQVDGASTWQTFRLLVIPLLRPVLATLAVLAFVWSWSDLLMSIVLIQDVAHRTLIPATALLTNRFNTNLPANAAAVVIALVPMLIVFLIGQRHLQRGILAGVGK